MKYPIILSSDLDIANIPERPLRLYLAMMDRLSEKNHAYKVWRTDIVVFYMAELREMFGWSDDATEEYLQYLTDIGLIYHRDNDLYWMKSPHNKRIMKKFIRQNSDSKAFQPATDSHTPTKLFKWRTDWQFTQKKAASILHVGINTYIAWESGKSKPNKTNLQHIENVLTQGEYK